MTTIFKRHDIVLDNDGLAYVVKNCGKHNVRVSTNSQTWEGSFVAPISNFTNLAPQVAATLTAIRKKPLVNSWCVCSEGTHDYYFENGECLCGIHKHHYHHACGGVIQVG